jgi:hypothetical protein
MGSFAPMARGGPILLATAIVLVSASNGGSNQACSVDDEQCHRAQRKGADMEGARSVHAKAPDAAREDAGKEAASRERLEGSPSISVKDLDEKETFRLPTVTLPLNWSNISSLTLLLVLAIIGGVAVWHVATRRTCRCPICDGRYVMFRYSSELL